MSQPGANLLDLLEAGELYPGQRCPRSGRGIRFVGQTTKKPRYDPSIRVFCQLCGRLVAITRKGELAVHRVPREPDSVPEGHEFVQGAP